MVIWPSLLKIAFQYINSLYHLEILNLSQNQINGVPQGSVLSLTLFKIALTNIVDKINPPGICVFFANDLINFFLCADYFLGEEILQEMENELTSWTTTNGLTFS